MARSVAALFPEESRHVIEVAMPPPPCPCASGRPFATCCAPCLAGEREAPDALALMRSRYTAFARGDAEYLWRTLAEAHPDRQGVKADVLFALRRAASGSKFLGLTVLDFRPADERAIAVVEFEARVFQKGRDRSFRERSEFLHDGTGWRYLSGEPLPLRR